MSQAGGAGFEKVNPKRSDRFRAPVAGVCDAGVTAIARRAVRSFFWPGFALALAFCQPSIAGPESCNLFADQDAYITQTNPDEVHGTEQQLLARSTPGDQHRPLVHYDLSAIPAGSTILSARAWFSVLDEGSAGPVQLHRVSSSWNQGSVTWSTINAAFDPTAAASFNPSPTGWQSADLTALVQDWHDGTFANHGVTFFPAGDQQSEYASSEHSPSDRRPCLEVLAASAGGMIDLSLTKVVDEPLPIAGTEITFTLTVSNAPGFANATGVVVVDRLPSGHLYTGDDSASSATTYNSSTGTWTVGTIPSGGSVTLEIRALVADNGNHTNRAEVFAANEADADSIPGNGVGQGEDDEAVATTNAGVNVPSCNTPASQDAWLDEIFPNINYGADTKLDSRTAPTSDQYPVLAFDLSSVPAGSLVTSATLWLHVSNKDDSGLPVNIYRITKSWNENSVRWNNLASDFDPAVRGSVTPIIQSVYVAADITALVQQWVDGTHDNDGLMLQSTSNGDQSKYDSRETGTPTERPCLEVQFVPGGTTAISGTVLEDINGDADLSDGIGRPQFAVTAFLDGGDGLPNGADDTPIATVATDINGDYAFSGLAAGTYWIRTNSKNLPATLAVAIGFTRDYLWPEQTFGAAGALCDDGAGGTAVLSAPGPCYGGRRGAVSDDPAALSTSEHVIRVELASSDVLDVDFGLSFAAVVNTRDGDDDLANQRAVQGSLRQFMLNANALPGPNQLRFVPSATTNASGPSGSWWEVATAGPLPTISDTQLTLDGTAYDRLDGSTVLDPNSAVNEQSTGPELVIDAIGGGPGLHVSDAVVSVQNLGLKAARGALDAGSGILVTGSSVAGSVIDNCTIWENDNSGVRIRSVAAGVQVSNSVIRDNGRADSGAHGIELDGAAGCFIGSNEIIDNPGYGIVLRTNANNSNTIASNLVKGSGRGGSWLAGIAVLTGSGNMIRDNIVTLSAGDGIVVAAGTKNSLIRNPTFANGGLGIDLGPGANGDGVTLNDPGDADPGPNQLLNYPVIESAEISGPNLILRGWTRPDSILQFFEADNDPSGFGEGAKFILASAEGSAGDSDPGVGNYGPGSINGLLQGEDAANRFEFVVPTPPGVGGGANLTAIATDISGNTSEFGGRVTVVISTPGARISGLLFEDADFAGTASGWDGGINDLALPGADVELYTDAGLLVGSLTTDASGGYAFSGIADGGYKVRVRSATVGDADTPPAGGLAASVPGTWPYPLPEMTWSAGAPRVGGQDPRIDDTATADDAGPGDTWVAVAVSGADVTGVDFGFAYNVIVTTQDDGAPDGTRSRQGSLRQFLKNANAIGSAGGTTANSSQFRIPVSDPGLVSGAYTVAPQSPLPALDEPLILDATTQIGFATSPIIELSGAGAGPGARGLQLLGGASTVRGLIINRFGGAGVWIASAPGNTIAGNVIGLASDRSTPAGNETGLWVWSADNIIGGRSDPERNVISANTADGIRLDAGSGGTVVQGNTIGVAADGTTPRGNGESGVEISSNSKNCLIGGTANGAGNIISGNVGPGVAVLDADTDRHRIRRNSIFDNGGLGIDLGDDGVTPNDPGDSVPGPNDLLNYPTLSSVAVGGGNTTIRGSYNGLSFETLTLEFYSSQAADPTNFGEGRTYIGTDSISTNFSGDATFTTLLPVALTTGDVVTAIALHTSGNTSEFSGVAPVTLITQIRGTIYEDVNGDADLGDAVGRPGVTVRVYEDDGNGLPGAGDSLVGTQDSDPVGNFTIGGLSAGSLYWVLVDASDVTASAGGGARAEQTYGPAGGLCTDGGSIETTLTRTEPGPCYGGRRGNVADDFDIAGRAEHVAQVNPSIGSAASLDFAFSFNVVTRVRNGNGQGNLRRFINNANTIPGPNVMRFVPTVPATTSDASGDWWQIDLASPLPTLTAARTTLDGAAWDLKAPASRRDTSVAIAEQTTGPELVLNVGSSGPGLTVEAGETQILDLGIANATGTLSGGVFVGMGLVIQTPAVAGTIIQACSLWNNNFGGIQVGGGAIDVQLRDNVVRGGPTLHALADSIELAGTSNVTVSGNQLVNSAAHGIDLRDFPNIGNTITNNLIKNSGLAPGTQDAGIGLRVGSDNMIAFNTISGSAGHGILIDAGNGNTISQNSIFDNAGLGIDLGPANAGDGVTLNDPGDADSGPNTRFN